MTAVAEEVETDLELGFKVARSTMFDLLSKAVSVVPTSDSLEVLKHFQVRAEDGKLTVASTDTQLSVVAVSGAVEVSGEGMAVFPAVRLLGLVKEAADGDLEILVKDREADIRSGHANWSLKLPDAEDFPALPDFSEMEQKQVTRSQLLMALEATRAAVSRDAMRPNLNVVSVTDGAFESSDGNRYHRVELDVDLGAVQIPGVALDDLISLLLSSDASEIGVAQSESLVAFWIGEDVYTAQKLVAKFPDMQKAILKPAQANSLQLDVDRLELAAAVRRVRVTADSETSAVSLNIDGKTVTLMTRDKFGSWAQEIVPCTWSSEESLEVTVNHRHLLEALEVVSSDDVTVMLGVGTKTRPAALLVKAANSPAIAVLSQLRKEFTG